MPFNLNNLEKTGIRNRTLKGNNALRNIIQEYLYIFSEFVEHALRLQAQSERRLSGTWINIPNTF